jgi:hypothetical protein
MSESSLTSKTVVRYKVSCHALGHVAPGIQMASQGVSVDPEEFPCLVFDVIGDGERFIFPVGDDVRATILKLLIEAGNLPAEQVEELRRVLSPQIVIAQSGDLPPDLPGSNGHGERHLRLT